MKEIKAPSQIRGFRVELTIFLAGSASGYNWRKDIKDLLRDEELVVYNPYREDWDDSWELSMENEQFRKQVEWELEAINKANKVLMYFAPETKASISLLELGLIAKNPAPIPVVCCPEGFWRKGNVDIVCDYYGIQQVGTLEELAQAVKS